MLHSLYGCNNMTQLDCSTPFDSTGGHGCCNHCVVGACFAEEHELAHTVVETILIVAAPWNHSHMHVLLCKR
jgi:hypothetical protein